MAQKLGIPTVIHEQNAFPGVTTKLLAKNAKTVMLAVADAEKHLERTDNCVVTGNPVRMEILSADREAARQKLGIGERPLVLSFGGSLGPVDRRGDQQGRRGDARQERKGKEIRPYPRLRHP